MKRIKAARLAEPPPINADWDKSCWRGVQAAMIGNYMGDRPAHFPKTQVKVACDEQAMYVIFCVEDQYVRAVAAEHQDDVYKDSCVEFFFAPNAESPGDYFNLEVNCGGTMLFQFHRPARGEHVEIPREALAQIEIASSLPRTIDPEIPDPVTWTVEYRLPLAILEEYCDVTRPSLGVAWRANFYKCADESSRPHWLTWAPVENPTPNFHLPEFFGLLEF
ncbi:MAG: carbohydrate-binding family 9-like protein [Phycisphaerales bacterium]|jgi:hypothetical protein|nr:carbohydrate-binding family 9-like protein [Phycisphaerales bacterium]